MDITIDNIQNNKRVGLFEMNFNMDAGGLDQNEYLYVYMASFPKDSYFVQPGPLTSGPTEVSWNRFVHYGSLNEKNF